MRVLDLGCGPGAITAGLHEVVRPGGGTAIGIDRDPGPAPVPLVRGDIRALPLPDASVDGVFLCAVLQHLADPGAALAEARRVCRPGAVVGIADADWGGMLVEPPDPLIVRGQELLTALRVGTSPFVGRELRRLLTAAGFSDVAVRTSGGSAGGSESAFEGAFQAALFDAPELAAVVEARGLGQRAELAAIADAWRRWAADPGATVARHWFQATGRVGD